MQALCGLQGIFDLFNCKTPVRMQFTIFFFNLRKKRLTIIQLCSKISSLTVERVKRGYKPSKYGRCSLFRSCIDMCYILSLSKTFVFLMRVRMEVLVMIS